MAHKKNEAGLFEVEIDGHLYEFEKWDAEESLDALIDIAKIIGKPLGAAIGGYFGKKGEGDLLDKEVNPDVMGMVFDALTERLDKTTVKGLIRKLCADKVFCAGKPINFKMHYQGKMGHMFKVVKAALAVQYENFFDDVLGLLGIDKKVVSQVMTQGK